MLVSIGMVKRFQLVGLILLTSVIILPGLIQAVFLNRGYLTLTPCIFDRGVVCAERDFQSVLDNGQLRIAAAYGLLQSRLSQGNLDSAVAMLRHPPLFGSQREVLGWLTTVNWYLAYGQSERLVDLLESTTEWQKAAMGWRLLLATETILEQGEDDRALSLAYLAASVKPVPEASEFYQRLGQVFMDLGCIHEAITQFEYAISLAPDDVVSLGQLGVLYEELKQYDIALSYYQRLAVLQPNRDWPIHRMALVYAREGRFDEAKTMLLQAMAEAPQNEYLLLVTLGAVYLWQGDTEQAEGILNKAIAMDGGAGSMAWAHSMLVNISLQNNQIEAAFEHVKVAAQFYLQANIVDDAIAVYQSALAKPELSPWKDYFQQQLDTLKSGAH